MAAKAVKVEVKTPTPEEVRDAKFIAHCKKVNEKMRVIHKVNGVEVPYPTEQLVANSVYDWLEDETTSMKFLKIISLAMGNGVEYPKPIVANKSNIFWKSLEVCAVIVPLQNKNGHNYELNEPCFVKSISSYPICLGMNGQSGNSLNHQCKGHLRMATDEEVDTFFAKVGVDAALNAANITLLV
jgi:hypothetical protein